MIFFEKHDFEWKSFRKKHDFEWKFFRSVRFWIKVFTKCQFFYQLFKHASGFELNISKILQRVGFWVYFFCSLPSFHVYITTVHVSVRFECMVWVWLVKLFC